MNRIVREHYPAAQLPKDLRPDDDPTAHVTVTIEVEIQRPESIPSTLDEIWAQRKPPFRTKKEIDANIRSQRDDWDD
jgi:hypothetical protein